MAQFEKIENMRNELDGLTPDWILPIRLDTTVLNELPDFESKHLSGQLRQIAENFDLAQWLKAFLFETAERLDDADQEWLIDRFAEKFPKKSRFDSNGGCQEAFN